MSAGGRPVDEQFLAGFANAGRWSLLVIRRGQDEAVEDERGQDEAVACHLGRLGIEAIATSESGTSDTSL